MGSTPSFATTALAAMIGALLSGSLWAADPLTKVPADVAGIVVLRNLNTTTQKINPFLKQINSDYQGLDLHEIGQGLDLAAGDWDPSSPVIIVLTRPEFSKESIIVAFKPAEGSKFLAHAREQGNRIWKRDEGHCESAMAFRDGVAFVGPSVKALRMIRHRPEAQSFAGVLDEQEKKMLSESDAFVRLDLTRWREKLSPLVMLGLGMMKLSAAAETKGDEGAAAVLDWMAGGARSFIDQMESTSFSFSFDRETLYLNHHHRFTPGQSVANYLAKVQSADEDLLSMVPNRPFLMFAASNWQCPTSECLAVSLSRHVMEMESVAARIPAEMRQRLTKELGACYGQMRGSAFMVTSDPGRSLPLQLIGGYAVKDSSSAIKQLCFIQENASEAMSAMLPSTHCSGKFERRREKGVDFMELNFNPDEMTDEIRAQLYKVYGEKVRYQHASGGPHRVMYAFAEPPTSVIDLVKTRPDDRVDKNPAVSRILDRLPKRPHLLVVFDLERTLAAVPQLAAPATSHPVDARTPRTTPASAKPSRGLMGWAVVVRPTSISGQWAMDAQDAVETFKLAKEMPQKLTKMSEISRRKIIDNP